MTWFKVLLLSFTLITIGVLVIFYHATSQPKQVAPIQISGISTIKIALLIDISNSRYQGIKKGCDMVIMLDRTIPTTTQPLSGALTELFKGTDVWQPWNNIPGNFISTQKQLRFDYVTINNHVANVYLKGSIGPLGGVCDDPRIKTEIEQTAFQFTTVSRVNVYINGQYNNLNLSQK